MTPVDKLYHQVLQKMIIVFLGLLTLSVFLTSCTTQQQACSAYDSVNVEQIVTPIDKK